MYQVSGISKVAFRGSPSFGLRLFKMYIMKMGHSNKKLFNVCIIKCLPSCFH